MNAFLQAELFELSPGYAQYQQKLLAESGLFDESPATLLEMKTVLADYRESKSTVGKK